MKKLLILFAIALLSCKKDEPIKTDYITVRIFAGSQYSYQILVKGAKRTLDVVNEDARTEKSYIKEFNSNDLKGVFVTVQPKLQPNTPQQQVRIDIYVNGKMEQNVRGFYPSGAVITLNHSINGGIVSF